MSIEQKANCTNVDSLVSVKVDINKDLLCSGSTQICEYLLLEERKKIQKFIQFHVCKGIYYNYQLKDGDTIAKLGITEIDGRKYPDEEFYSQYYVKVYLENTSDYEFVPFNYISVDEKVPDMVNYIGKTIQLVNILRNM